MYCIVVFHIQHGEVIPYRNTTIQYINTLINIEYVHYIQHGEVIPYRNKTIQFINTLINIEYYGITSPCCM
jgi:hypothetical protein